MTQDRSDIQFAVKELCRKMSNPDQGDWMKLKRLGRYLKSCPESIIKYDYQGAMDGIVAWTDSDFAGCKATRKSTGGGVMMLGNHLIKSWSLTQSVIALSSGEAEFYSLVKGASNALGLQAMIKDLGIYLTLQINTDATAAVGMVRRSGFGRVRHNDVSQLWIQDMVSKGKIKITKVRTEDNLSDTLTKHVKSEILKIT